VLAGLAILAALVIAGGVWAYHSQQGAVIVCFVAAIVVYTYFEDRLPWSRPEKEPPPPAPDMIERAKLTLTSGAALQLKRGSRPHYFLNTDGKVCNQAGYVQKYPSPDAYRFLSEQSSILGVDLPPLI
jgi:hypothetical protein